VPIRLDGVARVLHHTWKFPARGPVWVSFGPAILLEGNDYPALTRRLEEAVRQLGPKARVQRGSEQGN